MFLRNNCLKIDENKKSSMARKGVEVWFVIRLMVCAYTIVFTALGYSLFGTADLGVYERGSRCTLLIVTILGFD
jgi:hypothetical protein